MKRFVLPVALLVLGGGMTAYADIAYNDPVGQGTQNFGGNLALLFNVNSPITVTQLGVFNAVGDGNIAGPIQVAIYNLGTLALATTVTFQGHYATAGLGFDVFQSLIGPVTLGPGTYEVDAVGFSGADLNGNLNTGSLSGPLLNTFAGKVKYTGAAWDFSSSLDHPTTFSSCVGLPDQSSQFDAGTFAIATATTPEPGLYGTLVLGLFGLLAVARLRKTKNRA